MCTLFDVALAWRKSGLAHCQMTVGSGLVPLEDSVPIRHSLAYSPRGACACALPINALLAGHLSGSRMSGLCALPCWAPSAMALDLSRPLIDDLVSTFITISTILSMVGGWKRWLTKTEHFLCKIGAGRIPAATPLNTKCVCGSVLLARCVF